ncbi:hypothetical protein [Pedobacter kyungheensis]|uniref:hypothetical protein n=1 Tax=Pedobacter kyungheensis TaxID=1069985 RepID=UPI0012E01646|nr:hypothetical protein [Pedobacter kyungheensis]
MENLTEEQKVIAFVDKIILEWPDIFDRFCFKNKHVIYIHFLKQASSKTFIHTLLPKMGMFVDFKSEIQLVFLNKVHSSELTIIVNDKLSETCRNVVC